MILVLFLIMVTLYITQTKPFIAQEALFVGVSLKETKELEKDPKIEKCYSKYRIQAENENILWVNKTMLDEIRYPENLVSAIIPKGTEYWICDNFGMVIAKKIIKFHDSSYNPKGKREAFAKDILKQSGSFKPGWIKKDHSLVSTPGDDVIGVFGGNTPEGKPIIVGISDYDSCWNTIENGNFSDQFFPFAEEAKEDIRRNIEFSEMPDFYRTRPSSDWYLPPLGELNTVITQLVWVNAEIILAGGEIIGGGKHWNYWSATECMSSNCWGVFWPDGYCGAEKLTYLRGGRWFLDIHNTSPTRNRKGGVEILIEDEEHITLPLPRSDINLQVRTPCTVNFNFH